MSQNSQENTCAGALLTKVAGLWPTILLNRDHSTGYFPGILRNLFTEHLRMEKNWKKSKCFEVWSAPNPPRIIAAHKGRQSLLSACVSIWTKSNKICKILTLPN